MYDDSHIFIRHFRLYRTSSMWQIERVHRAGDYNSEHTHCQFTFSTINLNIILVR